MRKSLISFLVIVANAVFAQSITPSVINAGGKTTTTTINSQQVIYTDNIGEVAISTGSNGSNILTQGFLQPQMSVIANTSISIVKSDVSCSDKQDGYIKVVIDNLPNGANVKYFWTPSSLCPNLDCSKIDSLSAGNFTVKVSYSYFSGSSFKTDSVTHVLQIKDENGPCKIKYYTGIQINGTNPIFRIDNIEEFPDANVNIFNRWGVQLFGSKNYNNAENYWPKKGENVVPGTYFFIIDLGNGNKPIKGWVEVLN
ncbi:MAG: gliding motility-associated C-terminal domain-containing protein [Sphingobacteriaceae bacterium]